MGVISALKKQKRGVGAKNPGDYKAGNYTFINSKSYVPIEEDLIIAATKNNYYHTYDATPIYEKGTKAPLVTANWKVDEKDVNVNVFGANIANISDI